MNKLNVETKFWFATPDREGIFGEGKFRLLKKVKSTGSLTAAAGELGISYRKAWGDLKKAEKGLGFKLIDKERGGVGGGGTRITRQAIKLMRQYEEFKSQLARLAEQFHHVEVEDE